MLAFWKEWGKSSKTGFYCVRDIKIRPLTEQGEERFLKSQHTRDGKAVSELHFMQREFSALTSYR